MLRPNPIRPGPGQRSVWDFPRPPRTEFVELRVQVHFNNEVVADTTEALRVLETSHPPVYYIPREDVRMDLLEAVPGASHCEWKGQAGYFDVVVSGRRAERAAWSYPTPVPAFEALAGHLAFDCHAMDRCLVGDEVARPQPGNFYGGWVTDDVVGPFKGEPGSWGW
jgi:uncharacterized protein (DUF427 family)